MTSTVPTLHGHGNPLPNSAVNAGPKWIFRRQKRSKFLSADGPRIGGGPSLETHSLSLEVMRGEDWRRYAIRSEFEDKWGTV